VKGLVCGDSDALANGLIPTTVHVEAQAAKLLFHLQHFKLAAACLLKFGNQRFQILTEPPEYVEPAIVMSEAARHRRVSDVAANVEPPGPTLD
jgi:hypothetical protein